MKAGKAYSVSTIDKLIESASENGYAIVQVREGVLGFGHMLLIAPQAGYYSFEISEEYRNEWSSINLVRRFTRISKRVQNLIDSVGGVQ